MSENPDNGEGRIVNPPEGDNPEGEIVNPGMAADQADGGGDAGDQANDVRFAQEESLIGEQSQGVFPEEGGSSQEPGEEAPADGAGTDEGAAESTEPDGSDDPAHGGESA
ncbi:hypothetical protein [Arthrobacter castelli]|uniref:hypothetical protein n=1 Tax=Arthrobacter castelli TaxID=271431 RepID=UPI0004090DFA|nr:hypothetical protein [Arthrobacter castelli]